MPHSLNASILVRTRGFLNMMSKLYNNLANDDAKIKALKAIPGDVITSMYLYMVN